MATSATNLVDADGHIRDGERQYREYMEEPYRRRGLLGGGLDTFDRQMFGTLGGPANMVAQDWIDILDKAGMETTVLYPTIGLGVGFIQEPEYAAAFCRAYNNYVSEEFCKVSPRLRAVALLPLQAPEEAAGEMRRAVQDLKLVGGMLAADGPYLLGKPQYDDLYREAEQLGSMLAVHGSGSLRGRGMDEYLFDRLVQAHCLSHPYSLMRQMTSMIFEGVPERFPNLRLAYLEAGCTWVPYWMDRMDEEYEIRGSVEAADLTKKPSDYIMEGNIWIACEPEERLLPETLRIIGEGKVVFASDYPHWDGTFPESLYELQGREDLTAEQKDLILGSNPRALYGLS